MAELHRSSSPKQFFDVAKPNKSRPSATAKPVIVTNRPILQDPMVNALPSNDEPTTAPPLAIKLPTKINIQPLPSSAELTAASEPVVIKNLVDDSPASSPLDTSSPISEHVEKARAEAAVNSEPEVTLATDPAPPSDELQPVAPTDGPAETTAETAFKSGTAPISEVPKDGAQVTENDLADEESEDNEYDKNIQKLVTEKRYFLPINTQEKQRTKHFIILGVILIVLLAAAWADIALDAGLIHLDGIKPLTHFFSN